ncbi:kinase-associated lipoprotein B [Domibacillus robiginosus]|uniref:kinase-associated lipoprotein B n=1 Tax=Domibacillus robiginosus TaxID=1071054 RepID=UPI00067B0A3A|nr:kinase-associated lipoprotein B [Domibacillus robiginosus]
MNIGDLVTAHYKSGKYIGTITGIRPGTYTVKILSVLRHPAQGDLHNPNEAEVPFFHERKALAHYEQANIPESAVHPYEEALADYNESLIAAVHKLEARLKERQNAFSACSLESLQSVKKEYELMYKVSFE